MTVSELKDARPATWVKLTVAVSDIKNKTTKAGALYKEFTFSDVTGTVTTPIWNAADFPEGVDVGDIVIADGMLDFYNSVPQIKNLKVTKVTDFTEIDMSNLVPKYEVPKEVVQYFIDKVNTLAYPYNVFAKACTGVGTDADLFDRFCRCPSALRHHGNKIGGLILHTVGVMKNVENVIGMYFSNPFFNYGTVTDFNKDRMMLKAIIHDISKMDDYNFETVFSWKDDSKLDHRGKGVRYIERKNIELGDILSESEMNNISYSILSHHGAFGDGQYPFDNIEDFILHMADCIDAQIVGALETNTFKMGK